MVFCYMYQVYIQVLYNYYFLLKWIFKNVLSVSLINIWKNLDLTFWNTKSWQAMKLIKFSMKSFWRFSPNWSLIKIDSFKQNQNRKKKTFLCSLGLSKTCILQNMKPIILSKKKKVKSWFLFPILGLIKKKY